MSASQLVEVNEQTPLLLRRMEEKPDTGGQQLGLFASHMTVVTTPGERPEMHDQEEDDDREQE